MRLHTVLIRPEMGYAGPKYNAGSPQLLLFFHKSVQREAKIVFIGIYNFEIGVPHSLILQKAF